MGSPAKRIQYRYDSRGNRQSMIDPDGGRFTYSYDARNRIQSVQNPQGERTTYSYDVRNRRTVMELASGTRTSYIYDAVSNLRRLSNLKSDGSVISDLQYRYDKTGNRTSVVEADGSRVTWSYDAASQLTGEFRTGPTAYRNTFAYDPAGNRTLKNEGGVRTTYSYDVANQLQWSQDASGRTTYTFDADGNQERVQAPDGSRTTTVWDYENRATSIQLPSGIRNTMSYEPGGLRVKLEESTGTKKFVWDDQNYLAETDAANDTQVVYTNEPRYYGNLISQRRLTGGIWVPSYYHFDALGSTRQLTDGNQVITDQRLYDAWGLVIQSGGSTVCPFQFVGATGYYTDAGESATYVRARIYQPELARWSSTDPLFRSHLLGQYIYSTNTPLALIDSSGLLPCNEDRLFDSLDVPCHEPGLSCGGGRFIFQERIDKDGNSQPNATRGQLKGRGYPVSIHAVFSPTCRCCEVRQCVRNYQEYFAPNGRLLYTTLKDAKFHDDGYGRAHIHNRFEDFSRNHCRYVLNDQPLLWDVEGAHRRNAERMCRANRIQTHITLRAIWKFENYIIDVCNYGFTVVGPWKWGQQLMFKIPCNGGEIVYDSGGKDWVGEGDIPL